MIKDLWINLPVRDIEKSVAFFTQIGFSLNPQHGMTEHSASILIGSKKLVLMLFTEAVFNSFTGNEITDTQKSTEVLLSFDAESREEVEEITRKAELAGGLVYGRPSEIQSWMYGSGFTDLDGHRWNALFMDMSKMTKK